MAKNSLIGSDLIDIANDLLAGYQNAVDSRQLLTYLNEGKDEVWTILKANNDGLFETMSQSTDSTADYYFAPLTSDSREYTLPPDFREIKFIECLTANYTDLAFVYRKPTDEGFRRARIAASETSSPTPNQTTFLYTIIGKDQFVLADYPPTTLNVVLWYTRSLPDFEASDTIDEILFPFSKKIASYAAKLAMLGVQDSGQFAAWQQQWRESVITMAQGAAPRNEADAEFVQGIDEESDSWW